MNDQPRPVDDPTSVDPVPIYTKATLEQHSELTAFERYRRLEPTKAMRMTGPFRCETVHGQIASCEDGWLALDAHDYPYPITASVFEASYDPEPVQEG